LGVRGRSQVDDIGQRVDSFRSLSPAQRPGGASLAARFAGLLGAQSSAIVRHMLRRRCLLAGVLAALATPVLSEAQPETKAPAARKAARIGLDQHTAEVRSGDVLRATYEIKYRHHAFMAKIAQGRAEFYFSGQPHPFGYVRPGSPTAGAIWVGDDCIAEYDESPGQPATVTPIVGDRLQPDSVVEIDPITFLLQQAIERIDR